MEEKEKLLLISDATIREVVSILSLLPYGKVFQIINLLQDDLVKNNQPNEDHNSLD